MTDDTDREEAAARRTADKDILADGGPPEAAKLPDGLLLNHIKEAVQAETDARVKHGEKIGKLLIEAFHRYPSQEKFQNYLKPVGLTIGRCVELIYAAGGRKEGDELKRQLKLAADRVKKHRDKTKPKPAPLPPPQPKITVTPPDVTVEKIVELKPEPRPEPRSGDAKPNIVGLLEPLIHHMNEHGYGEKGIPEFLVSNPSFEPLDLIELSKWLKDFADEWKAHVRRSAGTGAIRIGRFECKGRISPERYCDVDRLAGVARGLLTAG